MKKIQEIIQEYEENRISLEELQDAIWGLSEVSLKSISEENLIYYLYLN